MSNWWHEVILLYSGLISDSSNFIQCIHDESSDDLCLRRLRLASLCLDEAVRVNTDVRASIAREILKIRTKGELTASQLDSFPEVVEYLIDWAKGQDWYLYAATTKLKTTASNIQSSQLYTQIANAFGDSESMVRQAAVQCLPLINSPTVLEELINGAYTLLRHDDADTRSIAATVLGKLKQNSYSYFIKQIFTMIFHDKQISVRRTCLKVLDGLQSQVVGEDDFLDDLYSLLNDNDPHIKSIAANVFPYFQYCVKPQHLEKFFDLLLDSSFEVQLEFINSLKKIFKNELVYFFMHKATDLLAANAIFFSRRSITARSIIKNLNLDSRIAYEFIDILFNKLMSHRSKWTSKWLVNNGKNPYKPGTFDENVTNLLTDTNYIIRQAVLELATRGDGKVASDIVVTNLLNTTYNKNHLKRLAAAEALIISENSKHKETVLRRLADLVFYPSIQVRAASIQSIELLAPKKINQDVVSPLLTALDDKFFVQTSAVSAIANLEINFNGVDISEKLLKILRRVLGKMNRLHVYVHQFIYPMPIMSSYRGRMVGYIIKIISNQQTNIISEDIFSEIFQYNKKDLYLSDDIDSLCLARITQKMNKNSIIKELLAAITSEKSEVQVFALKVTEKIDNEQIIVAVKDNVIKSFEDKSSQVRVEAIQTISSIIPKNYRDTLIRLHLQSLRDSETKVREAAWHSLTMIQKI